MPTLLSRMYEQPGEDFPPSQIRRPQDEVSERPLAYGVYRGFKQGKSYGTNLGKLKSKAIERAKELGLDEVRLISGSYPHTVVWDRQYDSQLQA